ncbi:hypothetical protein [Streptomyces sp. ADI95-16]|uniref:hypothetical protein n=1 Tax=Streptomyces sp. ADI95-16 TaxID=1522758 RepID=UPI0013DE0EB6|nr:hypothetical protein [Streptomyces sp. ADI95-16]
MSTSRRVLGAGPTTSTRTTMPTAPRLLPAERAEHQDDDNEHQAVRLRRGRRTLGTGPGGAS